ncbi:MAG TPA: hypothetical protein VLA56_22175 [Pseudomonadales bacterium]|nr:hypothetical protein [Pseudomonadales bacterium]
MRVITFDPFRTLAVPGARYLKAERWREHLDELQAADLALFPPYWLVDALVWGLGLRVFPSHATYHLGHDKVRMTRALQARFAHLLPLTHMEVDAPGARERLFEAFDGTFVAKTPRASEGRGVFLIESRQDWLDYCNAHPQLYVQERLDIDRDLRVVVIGDAVVASYWRIAPAGGFLNNVAAGGSLSFDPAPARAIDAVLEVARRLDIDHAGFDVAMVDGQPRILEFNRLFGNQGLREQGIRPDAFIAAWLLRDEDPDQPLLPRGGSGRVTRAA